MNDNRHEPEGALQVDTDLVRQLAQLVNESDLSEIEVQDGTRRIVVKRKLAAPAAPAPAAYAPPPPAPAPAAPAQPAAAPVRLSDTASAYAVAWARADRAQENSAARRRPRSLRSRRSAGSAARRPSSRAKAWGSRPST